MKESKYNYQIVLDGEYNVIFNGMTKRFFKVSKKNSQIFLNILKEPDKYYEQYKPFIQRMFNEGFVVNRNFSEEVKINQIYHDSLNNDSCMLLIYPTYQCNVRCWYCIQNHQDVVMSNDVIHKVKAHVKRILETNKKLKNFHISWFGGEPLLEYNTIIDITNYTLHLCNKHNVIFSASITTNGILLSEERIKHFKELNLNHYQITIDGHREKHNKVKRLNKQSAFDLTVNNIKHIAEINPEATINMRINYDNNCIPQKIMTDINSIIPEWLRKNITIVPCKIWQVEQSQISSDILSQIRIMGKGNLYNYGGCTMGICYVERKHFETIYPNGSVGKCDNDDMDDARGYLTIKGDVKWEKEYLFDKKRYLTQNHLVKNANIYPYVGGPALGHEKIC